MSAETPVVRRVNSSDADALSELFVRADVPCFCQYFQFEGDHRDWQNRCANSRSDNRKALAEQLEAGILEGFVAVAGDRVVGWARLSRPSEMQKQYQGRLYRGLPCFSGERESVRAITCYLVDPEMRRTGLARKLLSALIERAREQGATKIEAFPRTATDVTDEEQWLGPRALYESAGFAVVHDFGPYPVMALEI